MTTILVAIGAITQTVIEAEFGELIGKRRNKRMIDKFKNHFIICGFGRVGRGAASELRRRACPSWWWISREDRVEKSHGGRHAGGGCRFHAR